MMKALALMAQSTLPARKRVTAIFLTRCAFTVFVCLFTMPSALGQVASMTESWVDDYDPHAGAIVGCGVTDGNYDWEIHQTSVETTITSPSGRYDVTFSEDTKYPQQSGLYPYARAELSLEWDWNDMGSYVIESHHTSSCPVADFGTTVFNGTAGYSKICYQYDHTDNNFINPFVYQIVDGCAARISCYNAFFYSFYHVGMRGKSAQGWFQENFTGIKVCSLVQQPIIGGACDASHCGDVAVIIVP